MSWLGDVLFGKREKQPLLVHLSPEVIAGMETLVYLHNSRTFEVDHITIDYVLEHAARIVVRKSLKINQPEKQKPEELQDEHYLAYSRGRRQAR